MTIEEFDKIYFNKGTMLNTVRKEGSTTITEAIEVHLVDFDSRMVLGQNKRWYTTDQVESEYIQRDPWFKLCVNHSSIDYPCSNCGDCILEKNKEGMTLEDATTIWINRGFNQITSAFLKDEYERERITMNRLTGSRPLTFPSITKKMFNPRNFDDEKWFRNNLEKVEQCGFVMYESDLCGVLLGMGGCRYSISDNPWQLLYQTRFPVFKKKQSESMLEIIDFSNELLNSGKIEFGTDNYTWFDRSIINCRALVEWLEYFEANEII